MFLQLEKPSAGLVITMVEQDGQLVFGGHPALTPMIRTMLNNVGKSPRDYVTLYQSEYFGTEFPPESNDLEKIEAVPAVDNDLEKSLSRMRKTMIGENDYDCAVFVGGMEGVIEEYELFSELHPNKPKFPIASTGAAALQIYEENHFSDEVLRKEYTYPIVFSYIFREVEKYKLEKIGTK